MIEIKQVDIKENDILKIDHELLSILLKDRTTNKNIIWATDAYIKNGKNYSFNSQMRINDISANLGNIIKPRIKKSKKEQKIRIKDKAEVFTPSWVCNLQNNSIDEQWFQKVNVFNTPKDKKWTTNENNIVFPDSKTWVDYIKLIRLEISCGEAPYLVSRYDTTTGEWINVNDRIGILDRKLRVVSENTDNSKDWIKYATIAYKSTYGYEWQGDSLLIARENLLYTFIDYYVNKFNKEPSIDILIGIAKIISWNIWQMDGIKFVVPNSCKVEKMIQMSLFDENQEQIIKCPGCLKNNPFEHNGTYCLIMDWESNKKTRVVDILKEK